MGTFTSVANTATGRAPHSLPFFLPYIVPVITIITQFSSNPWHALLPSLFVWCIVPLLDHLIPLQSSRTCAQLSVPEKRHLDSLLSFRLAVYLWPPIQLSLLVWGAYRVSAESIGSIRLTGLLASLGLVAAGGINCSHELLHRRSTAERLLADLLLCSVCYGHFSIEHARGHHFRVATPDDPATLRFGESFYKFLPRTIFGGFLSAWRLEGSRLKAIHHPRLSVHNRIIWYAVVQALFPVVLGVVFGARAVGLFYFQSFCAVVLVEQVNAIEHYGLMRKLRADGSYERVGPRHSWDAPQSVSSYLLFKLQLHADHHLRTSTQDYVLIPIFFSVINTFQCYNPILTSCNS